MELKLIETLGELYMEFSTEELNVIEQWFIAVKSVDPDCLETKDEIVAAKLSKVIYESSMSGRQRPCDKIVHKGFKYAGDKYCRYCGDKIGDSDGDE